MALKKILDGVTIGQKESLRHPEVQEVVFCTVLRWLQNNSPEPDQKRAILDTFHKALFQMEPPFRMLKTLLCESDVPDLNDDAMTQLGHLHKHRIHFALMLPVLINAYNDNDPDITARLDLFKTIVSKIPRQADGPENDLAKQNIKQLLTLLLLVGKETLFKNIIANWRTCIDRDTLTELSYFLTRLRNPQVLQEICDQTTQQCWDQNEQEPLGILSADERDLVETLRVLLSCNLLFSRDGNKCYDIPLPDLPDTNATVCSTDIHPAVAKSLTPILVKVPFYLQADLNVKKPTQWDRQGLPCELIEEKTNFPACPTYEAGKERMLEILKQVSTLVSKVVKKRHLDDYDIKLHVTFPEETYNLMELICSACSDRRDQEKDDALLNFIDAERRNRFVPHQKGSTGSRSSPSRAPQRKSLLTLRLTHNQARFS